MKNSLPTSEIRSALRLVGLVGTLVSASILTGLWVGIKLEERVPLGGGFTVMGLLLGVLVGVGLAGWVLFNEVRRPSA